MQKPTLQHIHPAELTKQNIEDILNSNTYNLRFRVDKQIAFSIALFCVLILLRVSNLNYNTLAIDEAISVNVGQKVISGVTLYDTASQISGSHLFPITAALVNEVGGASGIRLLSATFSIITCLMIFFTSKRLFNFNAAFWGTLLFGTAGISLNLSQVAITDGMGVMFFSIAIYLLVEAFHDNSSYSKWYAIASGICFGLCFLAKYTGLLLLPALVVMGALSYFSQPSQQRNFLFDARLYYFLFPVVGILAVSILLVHQDIWLALTKASTNTGDLVIVSKLAVITSIIQQYGIILSLAVAGLVVFIDDFHGRMNLLPLLNKRSLLFVMTAFVLICFMVLSFYHIYLSTLTDLWQHNVYILVIIAPFAGLAIIKLIDRIRSSFSTQLHELRLLGVACLFLLFMAYLKSSFDTMKSYASSFPNIEDSVLYLQAQEMVSLREDLFVLSSVAMVYEYYLFNQPTLTRAWYSNWYFEYNNTFDIEGIRVAINDCALDLVILDDFYTNDINQEIEPLLIAAGYIQIYSTLQVLETGDQVGIRMYTPASHNQCTWRESS